MRLRAALATALLLAFNVARAASFSFALLGDAPYSSSEEIQFTEMLREINRADDIEFIVHVGDFKSGSSSCSDAVYEQRKELFAVSSHALIYVPGDNDWTDCWRLLAGRFDPLERLGRLRELFFGGPQSLGRQPLALTRQSQIRDAPAYPYPEHVRWIHGRVVFAAFNVPGGDNNLRRMPPEHAQRDAAARAWLEQAFALARREQAAAVVVLIHADPFTSALRPRRGYTEFLDLLVQETAMFDGQVLLVNGDTHRYRVDQPLRAPGKPEPLANLTRVEVFGSPRVNWVRVQVVDQGGKVQFEIRPGG